MLPILSKILNSATVLIVHFIVEQYFYNFTEYSKPNFITKFSYKSEQLGGILGGILGTFVCTGFFTGFTDCATGLITGICFFTKNRFCSREINPNVCLIGLVYSVFVRFDNAGFRRCVALTTLIF